MQGWTTEKQPYQWVKLGKPMTEDEIQATKVDIGDIWANQQVIYIAGDLDALAGQFTASD